jgi:ribonucleotide reductase alpha subunit
MNDNWIKGTDYPEQMTVEGLETLRKGYLWKDESPKDMYRRIAKTTAQIHNRPGLEEPLFEALFKQWICPATPVASNFGTDKGFPISCFSSAYVPDSVDGIMDTLKETAICSKYGGGTSIYISDVRAKGSPISKGGSSDGVVPFLKMFESTIAGVSQGGCYLPNAEVLTEKGFVTFKEAYNLGLKVLQVGTDNSTSWTFPEEWVKLPFKGNLINFKD